jgi:hypothetical protein
VLIVDIGPSIERNRKPQVADGIVRHPRKERRQRMDIKEIAECGSKCAILFVTVFLLSSCNGSVSVTYNPATGKATVSGTVSGRSKQIEVSVPAGGTIEIDDPDCGRIRVQAQCGATVKVKCGDPIVAEIPLDWEYLGGAYHARESGEEGLMESIEMSAFNGPVAASLVVADPGFRPVLVRADRLFPGGDSLDYTMQYAVPPTAVGTVLKAVEVAEIEYVCGSTLIHDLGLIDGEPVPNFPALSDAGHISVVGAVSVPALGGVGLGLVAICLGGSCLRGRRNSKFK